MQENGKVVDIAIIGAGPGGMACAIEAKLAGIENIIVIDKAPHHNDMIHKFYKKGKRVDKDWMGIKFEFKGNVTFEECSKEEYIQQMDDKLRNAGVLDKFEYNHDIIRVNKGKDGLFEIIFGHDQVAEGIEKMRAKNVILSVGRMGKPNKPKYPFPKEIKDRLNFNLSKVQNGERVMIVGGGDTAMDCVRTAKREGAKNVTCVYRRDAFNMPGSQKEYKNAVEEGVEFSFHASPKEVLLGDNHKAIGVHFTKTLLGAKDSSGRQKMEEVKGSDFNIKHKRKNVPKLTKKNVLIKR